MLEKKIKYSPSPKKIPKLKEICSQNAFPKKLLANTSRVWTNSPINLKLTTSSDNLLTKYASPIIKRTHELTEIMFQIENTKNSIKKIKQSCAALTLCANEEGYYSKYMKGIVEIIAEAIFQEKVKIDPEILSIIYEKHTDFILDSDKVPFFYISEAYQDMIDQCRKDINGLKSKLHATNSGEK